jgi:alpha-tubulin suppressor-like RCC1 family protein
MIPVLNLTLMLFLNEKLLMMKIKQITFGSDHTAAILADAVLANGSLVSWGDNRYQRDIETRLVFKQIELENY